MADLDRFGKIMKAIASALVESAAFLALTPDDLINPDSAMQALESIAYCFDIASEEEKKAVLDYCQEKAAALCDARTQQERTRKDFYLGFGVSFGILDE